MISSRAVSRFRSAVSAAALVALVLAGATNAYAYAFLLVQRGNGIVRRWSLDSLQGGRVPWRLSSRLAGNIAGDRSPLDTLTQAFATWEAIDTSRVKFAFQGFSDAHEPNAGDGVNLLSLDSNLSLPTGALAVTFVNSNSAGSITDADIVFSHDVSYSTSSSPDETRFDLQSVATHEIGHLFGLEHSAITRATMAPWTALGETSERTPDSDDQIGAALLYPDGSFPSQTGSLVGRVTLDGGGVFLANVVASNVLGQVVASAYSRPDGSYRIDGLKPDVYFVFAEPLDDPVVPGNVGSITDGFGASATTGYRTTFH
jgi:hypothetical protein